MKSANEHKRIAYFEFRNFEVGFRGHGVEINGCIEEDNQQIAKGTKLFRVRHSFHPSYENKFTRKIKYWWMRQKKIAFRLINDLNNCFKSLNFEVYHEKSVHVFPVLIIYYILAKEPPTRIISILKYIRAFCRIHP